MPDIIPSKELTKEEQARELLQSPQWKMYSGELTRMIESVNSRMDNCKPEEIGKLQGEKQGLRTALNLITEISITQPTLLGNGKRQ